MTLDAPAAGEEVTEGYGLILSASASDDVEVTSLRLLVNGVEVSAGQVPTGIADADLNNNSLTDLLVTTSDADAPSSKSLYVFMRTWEAGQFEPPIRRQYNAPTSGGDTRILNGFWDGLYYNPDVVVVDGENVIYFSDVSPTGGGGS